MTSHINRHKTTNIKPEILSGVQTENGTPHGKYNTRGIAYARTNRKDDIFMQRRLYIDEAHTALDIFRFAVFFLVVLSYRKTQQNYLQEGCFNLNLLQITRILKWLMPLIFVPDQT